MHGIPTCRCSMRCATTLGLHAAKFGCGLGQCGSCTVLLDDAPVRSCSVRLRDVAARRVVTAEGLGSPERPHPVQAAFIAEQAAQCGYCTNGMVMTAVALLRTHPRPTRGTGTAGIGGEPLSLRLARSRPARCAARGRKRRRPDHGTREPRLVRRRDVDAARLARSRSAGRGLRLRVVGDAGPWPIRSAERRRAHPAARRGRLVPRRSRRRHDRRPLGQGRSRHRASHRDAPDGRRGARRHGRPHRAHRGRHRIDAQPGPDGRKHRRDAWRCRAAPGRGDGARGAAGDRRRAAALAGGRPRARRRRSARAWWAQHRLRRADRRARLRRQDEPEGAAQAALGIRAGRPVAAAPRHTGQGHRSPCLRPRPRRSRHAARPRAAAAGGGCEGRGGRRFLDRRAARGADRPHRGFRRRRRRRRVGRGARRARAQGALERQRGADRQRRPGRVGARGPVRRRRDPGRQRRPRARCGARRLRRCAAGDVRVADPVARLDRPVVRGRRRAPDGGTVWTASQATHRFLNVFAALVELPREKLRVDLSRRRRLLRHERARRCRRRCRAALEGGRQARARAMEPRGRAGLGPQGPAATARAARRADVRRSHRRLANRHVGAARDGQPRMGAAARAARGRHAPAGRSTRRAGLAERRSAVPGPRDQGRGALARAGAAQAVEHPRAGQGRQLLRGRELRRRARREGQGRSTGVSAARPVGSARRRSDPPRGADDRLASEAVAGAGRSGCGRRRPRHGLHPLQEQRDLRRRRDGSRGRAQALARSRSGASAAPTTAG